MATNVTIDTELLDRAFQVGGERTMEATVTAALEAYISRRERARIIDHFGMMDRDPDYDYKVDRRSRDRKLDATR